jgi:hypothetical protein
MLAVQNKPFEKVSEEERTKIATLVLAFVGNGAIQGSYDMHLYHGPTVLSFSVTTSVPACKMIQAAGQENADEDDDGGFVMIPMEALDHDDGFVMIEKGDFDALGPAAEDSVAGSPTSVVSCWDGHEDLASPSTSIVVQVALNIGDIGVCKTSDANSLPPSEGGDENTTHSEGSSSDVDASPPAASAVSTDKANGKTLLQQYASMNSIEAIAYEIIAGVKESGLGRKYLLQTVIRGLHPDKQKGDIGNKIIAERVAKIANTIKGHFTENNLWDRPDDWKSHIKFLSRDQL